MNCEFEMQHRDRCLCRPNWTERGFLRWTKLITLRFALLLCDPSCTYYCAFLRFCVIAAEINATVFCSLSTFRQQYKSSNMNKKTIKNSEMKTANHEQQSFSHQAQEGQHIARRRNKKYQKIVVSNTWFHWFNCTVWGLCWYHSFTQKKSKWGNQFAWAPCELSGHINHGAPCPD